MTGAIDRFSEDVDVTIDYRDLAPSRPPLDDQLSNTRRKKLSEELRASTADHIRDVIAPSFQAAAASVGGTVEIDQSGEVLRVFYPSAISQDRKEVVLLEFGGRNITEPCTTFSITSDIAPSFTTIEFPVAAPSVLNVERTFWEKLTAIHYECNRPAFKPDANRLSRHWYDVYQLLESGHAEQALEKYEILESVVEHKKAFYYSSYADYDACLKGEFNLFPSEIDLLESDYGKMITAGMFYDTYPSFAELQTRIESLGRELLRRFSSKANEDGYV